MKNIDLPPAPPSGKKWTQPTATTHCESIACGYFDGEWHSSVFGMFGPLAEAVLVAVEDTTPTRYFRHAVKFGDATDYVELDGDVVTVVSKTGNRSLMSAMAQDVMGFVATGHWVEIPDPTKNTTLLDTALNSLEKLEGINKDLREKLKALEVENRDLLNRIDTTYVSAGMEITNLHDTITAQNTDLQLLDHIGLLVGCDLRSDLPEAVARLVLKTK